MDEIMYYFYFSTSLIMVWTSTAISLFAVLGCSTRLGIIYLGSQICLIPEFVSLFFAQSMGILLFSLVSQLELVDSHESISINPNFKEAFLVGYCGSLTTFSSLATDVWSVALKGKEPFHLGFFLASSVAMVFASLAIMYFSYGCFLNNNVKSIELSGPKKWELLVVLLMADVGLFAWGSLSMEPFWLTLLVSPVGAFLRYILSIALPTRISFAGSLEVNTRFLNGTFISNMLATILVSVLKIYPIPDSSINKAVISGFCGCLSTLSTLSKEWFVCGNRYLAFSMVTGLSASLLILGPSFFISG